MQAHDRGTALAVMPSQGEVAQLLDFLPILYPGGDEWLRCVLDEVREGRADCVVERSGKHLAGIAFGARKTGDSYKVRTLFVAPESRGRRIGGRLLSALLSTPRAVDASWQYITAAETVEPTIAPLLRATGFSCVARAEDRYGAGRTEVVFGRVNPVGA